MGVLPFVGAGRRSFHLLYYVLMLYCIRFLLFVYGSRSALITACLANLFAAFKGNENAKLMSTPGIKARAHDDI